MAWDGTTQERYRRDTERYESDLTDCEWSVAGPPVPPPSPPDHRSPRGPRRDPVHAGDGTPVAGDSQMFPAFHGGPEPLPPPARRRRLRAHDGRAARSCPRSGGALSRTDGGRDRRPVGEDGGDGRAVRIRRGQEGQGPQAAHRRRRRGNPGHGPRPHGGRPGPGRRAGRHSGYAGTAPEVRGLWADGGHGGDRLRGRLAGMGVPDAPGTVRGPDGTRGFTVPSRRWVVERTFAWMSRCRRLARDSGRSPESSVARARLAACRFPVRRLARGVSG